MIKVIIEIPKGDDRRRHLKYDKTGFIDLGPIKDKIPVNDEVMPVDYGFIPGTENKIEKDELDVLLISIKILKVGDEAEVKPIALMRRDDGDDKIVAVDPDSTMKAWSDVPDATKTAIIDFFGYGHRFNSIESAAAAMEYIDEARAIIK
jgi:inorganic pyrophosphatase